ncbi:hypothetical protein, conserved [Leishmania lindenbergi]|uniref:EF-hand domain-containing protein n=1 Tax=Leishmania lindenbergi TaxID=651832 RepID=A0AAW3ABV9_9TRYP
MADIGLPRNPFESHSDKGSELAGETLQLISAASGEMAGNLSSAAGAVSVTNRTLTFPVADDSDPLALLYSTPAHQPLSLARRTCGTEPLFQYYVLRGYKEILSEPETLKAAKAVQACLEDGDAAAAGSGMAAAMVQHRLSGSKKSAPSLNTSTIDKCLLSIAAAAAPTAASAVGLATDGATNSVVPLYLPLRPTQALDVSSSYCTQRAEEMRAAAEQERSERLRLVPEAAVYLGRYYPEDSHIVANVQLQLAEENCDPVANAGTTAKFGVNSSNPPFIFNVAAVGASMLARSPALDSVPLPIPNTPAGGTRFLSSLGPSRHLTAKEPGRLSAPSIAPLLLRTPQEAAVTMQMQQEGRHVLADQIEESFVNAYHLRDPAAAQRQRDRESLSVQRHSMQAAAALRAGTGSAAAAKKRSILTSSKKLGGKAKKLTVAPPKREGGVPANLELFRTSLLLACSEDGAVTLGQLRVLLASVPFHVGTLTSTSAADLASVAQRLFHIIHSSTRACNAADATDLLLAFASAATAGCGGSSSRLGNAMGDNLVPTAAHALGNSLSRVSNAGIGARRGVGASATLTTAGQMRLSSVSTQLLASNASVISPIIATADAGGSTSGGAHTPKTPSLMGGTAASCHEASGAGNGRRQSLHHRPSADMHDEWKSILVVEVLDALDALLNSVETKRVVRWECFNVLAAEGNGYIHKSQLAKLRRHAYRDGSAAEEQAAVTAAMVKALSDVFAVVATEEEAAYIKANKKRKKKGGAVALAAHQSSPIPLNVMRKSHIDYAVFCRFFDEMPLMSAAFAHVWLPLLLNGRRHTTAAGGTTVSPSDAAKSSIALPGRDSVTGTTLLLPPSPGSSAEALDDKDGEEASPNGGPPPSQSQRRAAPAAEDDPNASPLELLGSTVDARQAAVWQLVTDRQKQLHQACDAAEKEKLALLQSEQGSGRAVADS